MSAVSRRRDGLIRWIRRAALGIDLLTTALPVDGDRPPKMP